MLLVGEVISELALGGPFLDPRILLGAGLIWLALFGVMVLRARLSHEVFRLRPEARGVRIRTFIDADRLVLWEDIEPTTPPIGDGARLRGNRLVYHQRDGQSTRAWVCLSDEQLDAVRSHPNFPRRFGPP